MPARTIGMVCKKRILIIDPNRFTGYLFSELLRSAGMETVTVPNLSAAFHLLKKKSFNLILTDLFTDIVHSFSIFSRLNKSKIMLLTNTCEQRVLSDMMKRGAGGYIIKSRVTAEEFVHLIRLSAV